jgi:hypothetical protein
VDPRVFKALKESKEYRELTVKSLITISKEVPPVYGLLHITWIFSQTSLQWTLLEQFAKAKSST